MGNCKKLSNIVRLKYHYVYTITNKLNGKIYVGRHSTNNLDDGYFGSGKMLKRAINKYGKENFSMEKIIHVDSYHKSVLIEALFVDKTFCNNENTYNIVEGGYNPVMYGEQNPSWKGGISKDPMYRRTGRVHDFSGKNNPMYGKTHTPEVREKLSIINMGRTSPNKGKKLSREERDLHILKQSTCKGVWVDNSSFRSIRDCARKLNVSQNFVQGRLRSKRYNNWRYGEYDEKFKRFDGIKIIKGTSRKVIQLDLDGNYINEYNSIREASKKLGLSDSDIGYCCWGKKRESKGSIYTVRTCGGFKWKFKSEFEQSMLKNK